MALSLDCVAGTFSVNQNFSVLDATINNDTKFSITARKADGSAYDFTSATGATLNIIGQQNLPTVLSWTNSHALASVTGDATKLVGTISGANLYGIVSGSGQTNFRANIEVTDGTNVITAATGNVNINVTG